MHRVCQNRICTLYMTVYLVIPCQKFCIYTAYIWFWPTLCMHIVRLGYAAFALHQCGRRSVWSTATAFKQRVQLQRVRVWGSLEIEGRFMGNRLGVLRDWGTLYGKSSTRNCTSEHYTRIVHVISYILGYLKRWKGYLALPEGDILCMSNLAFTWKEYLALPETVKGISCVTWNGERGGGGHHVLHQAAHLPNRLPKGELYRLKTSHSTASL
jgi:hypothetical protein